MALRKVSSLCTNMGVVVVVAEAYCLRTLKLLGH